jgi:hypothetical protein
MNFDHGSILGGSKHRPRGFVRINHDSRERQLASKLQYTPSSTHYLMIYHNSMDARHGRIG